MTCVYDNPSTCQRECWQDGRLIYSVSFRFLMEDGSRIPGKCFFHGANIGNWKTGQVLGDIKAMEINLDCAKNY